MNEPPPQWLYIALLIILLFLSMLFSSGETAYLSVNKLKIKYLREKKNKKAIYVEKILQNKQKFLTTSLIGNSLVNILISVILTSIMVNSVGSNGLTIAVTVATIAILVFGEIIPKSIALVFSESIALKTAKFITFLMILLTPVTFIFSLFTEVILKKFNITKQSNNNNLTDADLKDFFEKGKLTGKLSSDEQSVLNKILNYGDITVKNIMTPRPNIVAIKENSTFNEIIEISKNSHFSRFPVYNEDIDNIAGIFYIKDFLLLEDFNTLISDTTGNTADFQIQKYLRKPVFVFENTELAKLQEIFKTEKQNIVIVIDEYGGTLGIVTIEDLNEEIIGNIVDEYDIDESVENNDFELTFHENNVKTISGSTRLNDLNEMLGINLKSKYYKTIGGLLMENCGEVPKLNTKIKIENYTFLITKIEKNKISELKIYISGEE